MVLKASSDKTVWSSAQFRLLAALGWLSRAGIQS
jgi:hypothetical protein